MVNRIRSDAVKKALKKYSGGRLLDIGCGDAPYREFIKNYFTTYTGLDHEKSYHNNKRVDIIGTAYEIPEDSDSFDVILCTAVLEHLEDSVKAIKEAYRVLKPGGYAIYTVPLFWYLHEVPRDYYRFTEYGIRYVFGKAGFKIIELKPLSGFWVTFCTQLNYYLSQFKRRVIRSVMVLWILLNNIIMLLLNKIDRSTQWTWMYLVVVRK